MYQQKIIRDNTKDHEFLSDLNEMFLMQTEAIYKFNLGKKILYTREGFLINFPQSLWENAQDVN